MIGHLRGIAQRDEEDTLIVDVGGVGYLVNCPVSVVAIATPGEFVELYIETHVREDAFRLYGFSSRNQRTWFRRLNTVKGVGAKVALAVLSVLEPDALASALSQADKSLICRAPGVGPKVAERMIAELREISRKTAVSAASSRNSSLSSPLSSARADAEAALIGLGYSRPEIATALQDMEPDSFDSMSIEELISTILRRLAPRH